MMKLRTLLTGKALAYAIFILAAVLVLFWLPLFVLMKLTGDSL